MPAGHAQIERTYMMREAPLLIFNCSKHWLSLHFECSTHIKVIMRYLLPGASRGSWAGHCGDNQHAGHQIHFCNIEAACPCQFSCIDVATTFSALVFSADSVQPGTMIFWSSDHQHFVVLVNAFTSFQKSFTIRAFCRARAVQNPGYRKWKGVAASWMPTASSRTRYDDMWQYSIGMLVIDGRATWSRTDSNYAARN